MNTSTDAQHFTLNANHGHDAGVWVCEGSGLGLGPVLFLQALCPDPAPRALSVKWKPAGAPPRSFRSTGTLPLIYSECGRIPPWPHYLHLFAPQAPIAQKFELESGLSDWHLTVPVLGIIVIFDRKYDPLPAPFSWRGLKGSFTSSNPKRNRSFEWAQAQHLPLIIAGLGYDNTLAFEEQLRARYDIPDDIPIVPGPSLADARRKAGQANSGMLAFAFEPQQVTLDREYARHAMSMLYQQIEKQP